MQTSWFRKVKEIIEAQDVENYVQMYCNQYKTNCVLSTIKQVMRDERYCIEVWLNLNSGAHAVNVFTYYEFEDETEPETEQETV